MKLVRWVSDFFVTYGLLAAGLARADFFLFLLCFGLRYVPVKVYFLFRLF